MKVQLLVSEWCQPCRGAEEVWRAVARRALREAAHEALEGLIVAKADQMHRPVLADAEARGVPYRT